MFGFFKKGPSPKEIVETIKVDIHSHLIPGIDDGAQNLEDSLSLISKMQELGYKKLIITPHIMVDTYPNREDDIKNRLLTLRDEVKKRGIDIQLEAAAEYYLDEGFLNHLEEPLLIADTFLLFETSYMSAPINFDDIIFLINTKYTPLLAHPERYRYIKDLKEYDKLKKMGVYFQIDINSIAGHYGKDAQKKSEYLINNGLVDFVGSDLHNKKHINNLINSLTKKNIWYNLFEKNEILNSRLI